MNNFKLKPVLTEKTLRLAKDHGIYTFSAPVFYTKEQVKKLFKQVLDLEVKQVRMVKLPSKERGKYSPIRTYKKPAKKKFYVTFEGKVEIPGYDKLTGKK